MYVSIYVYVCMYVCEVTAAAGTKERRNECGEGVDAMSGAESPVVPCVYGGEDGGWRGRAGGGRWIRVKG